jgi:hypothetical protein
MKEIFFILLLSLLIDRIAAARSLLGMTEDKAPPPNSQVIQDSSSAP